MYAGDVLVLGRWVRAIDEGVTQTKEDLGTRLVTNEIKTKYMKINRNITNLEQDLIMNGQVFEGVRNFRYIGVLINSKKLIIT
jgi:hypothetical protein